MKKPSKEVKMFMLAESFRVAVEVLTAHWSARRKVVYLQPIWINQALTCELYLKCLVSIKTKIVPKHHRLHELFDQLPKADRAILVNNYKTLCKADLNHEQFFRDNTRIKDDLRSVLEGGAEVFSRIRYSYEGIGTDVLLVYFPLPIMAIRKTILDCQPDYPSKLSA